MHHIRTFGSKIRQIGFFMLFLMAGIAFQVIVTPASSPPKVMMDYDETVSTIHYSLPVGMAIPVFLQTPVHTAENQVNDPIEAIVTQDIYVGRRVLFDKNTRLKGFVARIEQPMEGMNAILVIRFNELKLSSGESKNIEAHVKTERSDNAWGGELTPGTKPMRVTHRVAGIGSYNQTLLGGPRQIGKHQAFFPGEHWMVVLEQPVSFSLPSQEL